MKKTKQTIATVRALLDRVHFDSERIAYRFHVGRMGGGWYLQVRYFDEDADTGKAEPQHGRKWYVSRHATDGEVVQTALKAILTSLEHFAREHFRFDGQPIYGPHFELAALVEAARARRVEGRTG
jgi:hypothetical protein